MNSDAPTAPAGGTPAGTGGLPFDTSKAHQARVYDYLLGGKDNYEADRAAAKEALRAWPGLGFAARANRALLGRMVSYLAAEAGIRQFLDLGTGIPTAGNTHEVAQAIAPESRVVYVDYDPVVLAHARALLTSHEAGATAYIDADLRDPHAILAQAAELLDFGQPVAVTMLTILHAVPDRDDPHAIVAAIMGEVPAGSYLAISHAGADLFSDQAGGAFKAVLDHNVQQRYSPRTREEIARFFTGTELVEPGLVPVEEWRPDHGTDTAGRSNMWAAAGRKTPRN